MKKLLFLFLILISGSPVFSQTQSINLSPVLEEARPGKVGLSAERLDRIDKMLKKAVDENEIPGAVALVARKGKIVFHKAYGMADNSTGEKLEKDDIFRIASQTKAITSTAVMMLWEEGLFRLDDPISKYIPEFKDPVVLQKFRYSDTSYTTRPAKSEITIRHLLTHTSGLGYGFIDGNEQMKLIYARADIKDAFTTEPIRIEDNIKKLAGLPLEFDPGTRYKYSEGLDVLGYFVEVISGMPFDRFLRERMFDPLGMDDTWFYLPDEQRANRLVSVQTKEKGEWVPFTHPLYDAGYPVRGAKMFFAGGAGLSSTAKDYAIFLQMYLNGGEYNGIRLLSRKTVETIMANQIGDLWEGRDSHHGLAFGVTNETGVAKGGLGSAGTFNWGGYFNTIYFADMEEQMMGLLFKQTRGIPDNTSWKFRQLVGQSVDD